MKKVALLILATLAVMTAVYSCGGDGSVAPPRAANRPPLATGTIPATRIFVGETTTVDVAAYFHDPDGDRLAYDVAISPRAVASVSIDGSVLTIAGLATGRGVVTVIARDPAGLSVHQQIDLNVEDRFGYLNVDIRTGQADWGAVVLFVAGPQLDSLQAAPKLTLYSVPEEGGVHVFVAGPIPQSGRLFRFWTDDRVRVGEYVGRLGVAVGRNYEQRNPVSATVTVGR